MKTRFIYLPSGLVISTIFTTEINAHQVTMATFYPVLLLSGNEKSADPDRVNSLSFDFRHCLAARRTADLDAHGDPLVTDDQSDRSDAWNSFER
jgi:hypothetical protein